MRRRNWIAACGAVLWILVSAVAWCTEAADETGSWKDYSIVSERNIFSRTRRARSTASSQAVKQTPEVARTEQSYLVLRGVVREKDVFISFIEDSRTGEVKKVRQGESLGDGMVSAATLDFISYNFGDADIRIEIGKTLEGKTPETSSSPYYSGSDYYSQPTGFESRQTVVAPVEQTVVSEDEAKDILQRLKERRKKELGE
jgi:hypothetical protein